jgi:hypothetical protein
MKFRKQTHGCYHSLYQSFTGILGLKLGKYGWQRSCLLQIGRLKARKGQRAKPECIAKSGIYVKMLQAFLADRRPVAPWPAG